MREERKVCTHFAASARSALSIYLSLEKTSSERRRRKTAQRVPRKDAAHPVHRDLAALGPPWAAPPIRGRIEGRPIRLDPSRPLGSGAFLSSNRTPELGRRVCVAALPNRHLDPGAPGFAAPTDRPRILSMPPFAQNRAENRSESLLRDPVPEQGVQAARRAFPRRRRKRSEPPRSTTTPPIPAIPRQHRPQPPGTPRPAETSGTGRIIPPLGVGCPPPQAPPGTTPPSNRRGRGRSRSRFRQALRLLSASARASAKTLRTGCDTVYIRISVPMLASR